MFDTTSFLWGALTMGAIWGLHDWVRNKIGKRCDNCGRRVHFADCLCDLRRRADD